MSTYNGEKYIREQIDSILEQSYQDIELLIRDDGSRDNTLLILKEYEAKYINVKVYFGENIGVRDSFFDLFSKANEEAEYIALSDQDDVWKKDKIKVAVESLRAYDEPSLYCCKPQLVDEELNIIEDKLRTKTPKPTFGNAIIENICTGCTIVFNQKLLRMIKNKRPQKELIHDMWLYQVATCFGTVIYDEMSYVYYRQHSDNVIGLDNGRRSLIKRQIMSLKKFRGKYTSQIEEFKEMFNLSAENERLVELMLGTRNSWKCRFRILFEKRIYRQGKYDNILFKGMLFLGIL